jgi:hypothetical protein
MKKEILTVVGITILFLGISLLPITQGTINEKFNVKYDELDYFLRFYKLNIESTIDEFEKLLYKLVAIGENRYPLLTGDLKNEIEELSNIFDQIGVTNDLTIKQALPLIENNKVRFRDLGINIFCSIKVKLIGGSCFPHPRYFKVVYGNWRCWEGYPYGPHTIRIKSIFIGLQYCEDDSCGAASGDFVGLIGIPPVMLYFPAITAPWVFIRGNFVLFSHSNLPFV